MFIRKRQPLLKIIIKIKSEALIQGIILIKIILKTIQISKKQPPGQLKQVI
jgi:hypothetical protein